MLLYNILFQYLRIDLIYVVCIMFCIIRLHSQKTRTFSLAFLTNFLVLVRIGVRDKRCKDTSVNSILRLSFVVDAFQSLTLNSLFLFYVFLLVISCCLTLFYNQVSVNSCVTFFEGLVSINLHM